MLGAWAECVRGDAGAGRVVGARLWRLRRARADGHADRDCHACAHRDAYADCDRYGNAQRPPRRRRLWQHRLRRQPLRPRRPQSQRPRHWPSSSSPRRILSSTARSNRGRRLTGAMCGMWRARSSSWTRGRGALKATESRVWRVLTGAGCGWMAWSGCCSIARAGVMASGRESAGCCRRGTTAAGCIRRIHPDGPRVSGDCLVLRPDQ